MKSPTHISLDVSTSPNLYSNKYWVFRYLETFNTPIPFLCSYSFQKKFIFKKGNLALNRLLREEKKHTLRHSQSIKFFTYKDDKYVGFLNSILTDRVKMKRKPILTNFRTHRIREVLLRSGKVYDRDFFLKFYKSFDSKKIRESAHNDLLWNIFDLCFLKKEKIYTKLKYSRVPQYDIVSGGGAALLAGFLGFLICEKFGFELLDSGDFFYLFMYIVFFCFFCRLFLKTISKGVSSWNIFSYKWFFFFYKSIFFNFFNFIKSFFKK